MGSNQPKPARRGTVNRGTPASLFFMTANDYIQRYEKFLFRAEAYSNMYIHRYGGRPIPPTELFVLYCLFLGVANISAHVQHFAGRVEPESLMVWDNNIVIECPDPENNRRVHKALGMIITGGGWRHDYRCGGSAAGNDQREKIRNIIVYFHSIKSDFARALKELHNEQEVPYL